MFETKTKSIFLFFAVVYTRFSSFYEFHLSVISRAFAFAFAVITACGETKHLCFETHTTYISWSKPATPFLLYLLLFSCNRTGCLFASTLRMDLVSTVNERAHPARWRELNISNGSNGNDSTICGCLLYAIVRFTAGDVECKMATQLRLLEN